MDLGISLFVLMVFVMVVFLLEGAYVLWERTKGPEVVRLERRLRTLSAGHHGTEEMSLLKKRNLSNTPWLDQLLLAVPRVSSVDRWLQQSGLSMSVARFGFITIACALTALLVCFLLRVPGPLILPFVLVAAAVPSIAVARVRSKRLRAFNEQLPDALDLMSRALRAGHAFSSALQMVGTEASDPIASEFHATFEELNYGIGLNDAMMNLATRVPSMDLRYFVISVILQRETGGNLSELLGTLSTLIRQRFELLGRVRVLSAEGKLSAYILVALPFATATVIYLSNPDFMKLLWTDPVGLQFVAAAILMMILGSLWMWRIVKIRV